MFPENKNQSKKFFKKNKHFNHFLLDTQVSLEKNDNSTISPGRNEVAILSSFVNPLIFWRSTGKLGELCCLALGRKMRGKSLSTLLRHIYVPIEVHGVVSPAFGGNVVVVRVPLRRLR
jgi:hypothetical protein